MPDTDRSRFYYMPAKERMLFFYYAGSGRDLPGG